MLGSRVLAANGAPRTYKIAWSQTAVCQSPVSVALERGFFDKYNLKVERINFSGSTDQLLEAIATGHADGGIGMAPVSYTHLDVYKRQGLARQRRMSSP